MSEYPLLCVNSTYTVNFLDTQNIAIIALKFKQIGPYSREKPPNEYGIANSEQSDLGLHCFQRLICPKI